MNFIAQSLAYSYFLFLHLFRMMYWVWIPGFLFSAFFSMRYQEAARSRLLSKGGLVPALLYGVTTSPSRKATLQIAAELKQKGIGESEILAFLIANQNLVIYFLVILMAMMGAEFALGQLMGGIIMASLVTLAWRCFRGSPRSDSASPEAARSTQPTWGSLALSRSGWWEAVKYGGREFRFFWLNLFLGFLVGGFILSAGLKDWWPDLYGVSPNIFNDLLCAFTAPLMAVIVFIPPVGNLPLVSNLFKAYTFTYSGVVSFLLASLLNPLILPTYFRLFGKKRGSLAIALLYVAAAVSGLLVTWSYALFDFRPGHVPMGRNLVDEIIKALPFTMGV